MTGKILFLMYILVFFNFNGYAQYLRNPSLDGDEINEKPKDWKICNIYGKGNSPDMFSQFGDEFSETTINNIDGKDMCLLRTRGVNFATESYKRTFEHISSELLQPLKKNNCYKLSIYLCYVPKAKLSDTEKPNISFPLRFQVWGANDSCTFVENFIDTEPITNQSFQKYEFHFSVTDDDYTYIYVRPYWDTVLYEGHPYSGIMLLDKMDLEYIKPLTKPTEKVLYYQRNPPIQINAGAGKTWDWTPKMNLSAYDVQSPYILGYTENSNLYNVLISDEDGCPYYESYRIDYVCDKVYPNKYFMEHQVFYKLSEQMELSATSGRSYQWNADDSYLSDPMIQNPMVLKYRDSFEVEVVENTSYNCKFKELFELVTNCDTLLKGYKDTIAEYLVDYGDQVVLEAIHGEIYMPWNPPTFDACDFCNVVTVKPDNSTVYSVGLQNQFNNVTCQWNAYYNVNIKLKIPNVITPGSDGRNDVFKIPGLPPETSVHIFSKEGNLVFEANPYLEWWDGTDVNGHKLPGGNYWYILKTPGTNKIYTGFVMLIW